MVAGIGWKESPTARSVAKISGYYQNLAVQKGLLEQEIEESRQRAETIDQQAIEAKKREMLEKEAEYADLSARIEASQKLYGVIGDIGDLQKKYKELKGEVDYLSIHKNHLTSDTSGLELQFQQLI